MWPAGTLHYPRYLVGANDEVHNFAHLVIKPQNPLIVEPLERSATHEVEIVAVICDRPILVIRWRKEAVGMQRIPGNAEKYKQIYVLFETELRQYSLIDGRELLMTFSGDIEKRWFSSIN